MKNLIPTLLVIVITIISCNPSEPENNRELNLKVEDVSCIEAWINIKTNNISLPAQINITANSKPVNQLTLTTSDSLIVIDSLHPNSGYTFQATMSNNITSNNVNTVTMDTTSNNFAWETFAFGDEGAGSSVLFDVAIIDEDNIWAVGKIFLNDSLGQPDPRAYNVVHWNKGRWELKRIKTNACGGVEYPPIKAILTFSSNDILFAHTDGSISQYNGLEFINDCSLITQLNGSANKMWGVSSVDFYVVSGSGFIAHYQNGGWSKIESGTELNINDIWGQYDKTSRMTEILVVCGNILHGSELERQILKIDNNKTKYLNARSANWPLRTTWFIPSRKYFIAGSGIYEKQNIYQSKWQNLNFDITPYSINKLRGDNLNNIAATGGAGEVLHFNGKDWRSFYSNTQLNYGNYYSLDIKENVIVAVGQDTPMAVITIGKKQ